jgi:hypothetical protein
MCISFQEVQISFLSVELNETETARVELASYTQVYVQYTIIKYISTPENAMQPFQVR